MVNDKSFGIVSQELMFSILHDCAMGGRRVLQGSFCPVQLINLTIIPQVGRGGRGVGGHSTTCYTYREVPPLGLTPYTCHR